MDKLRIAVIGDKKFDDYSRLASILDSFIKIHQGKSISIVSNNKTNPLAKKYASENGINFGRQSKRMIRNSDRVIAFRKGVPGEAQQAIEEANREGIPSYVVEV